MVFSNKMKQTYKYTYTDTDIETNSIAPHSFQVLTHIQTRTNTHLGVCDLDVGEQVLDQRNEAPVEISGILCGFVRRPVS